MFSLNNHKFSDYFYDIYPVEFEIKETTDDQYHSSFLDLLLENDKDSRLRVIVVTFLNHHLWGLYISTYPLCSCDYMMTF